MATVVPIRSVRAAIAECRVGLLALREKFGVRAFAEAIAPVSAVEVSYSVYASRTAIATSQSRSTVSSAHVSLHPSKSDDVVQDICVVMRGVETGLAFIYCITNTF